MSRERLANLTEEQKTGYWRATPDVVIEVLSGTDRWTKRKKKIDLFFGDGATYAVAINPKTREIYERGEAPPGLSIDFAAVIDA